MAEFFPGPEPNIPTQVEAPKPTPERKLFDDDDDDEVVAEKPSIMELLKGEPEKPKVEKSNEETLAEKSKADNEIEESPEADEPTEQEMTPDEVPVAAVEISEARESVIKDEVEAATAGSLEEKEALVGAKFQEAFQEEVSAGANVDDALDGAEAKTLEVVGIEPPNEPETDEPVPPAHEAAPVDIDPLEEPPVESDPITPVPPVTPGGATATTGGNVVPPIILGGPAGPAGPAGPGGPRGGGGGPGVPGSPVGGFNAAPSLAKTNHNTDPGYSHDHSHIPYVLAGGLVGYLIGRRRGRIKTEKKLLPIQRKLEKEVKLLHDKIAGREMYVRSVVHERVADKPEQQQEIIDRLVKSRAEKAQNSEDRRQQDKKREQLGKFAVTKERPSTSKPELTHVPEKPKLVAAMNRAELLQIAQIIEVEDSNLRKLFESNRLDDKGLRRVIEAYLRGERYDRILRDNLLTPNALRGNEYVKDSREVMNAVSDGANPAEDLLPELQPIDLTSNTNTQTPATNMSTSGRVPVEQAQQTKQTSHTAQVALATAAIVAVIALLLYFLT